MSTLWEETLRTSSAGTASLRQEDSEGHTKTSVTGTDGITLKTSPVEIAAPYFSKNSAKIPVLEAASILTNEDGHFREDGKKIVEYKVDWDEHNFSPVRARRDTNTLIAMCHMAFAEHRPMALTPDLLWHYILKGISIHIQKHSEVLRKKFVSHEGKKELTVHRDMDIGDLNADVWSTVFKDFRSEIEANLTEHGKAIISKNRFSTTSEVIDDVSCIALMYSMANYFAYRFKISCGIPSVTLLGNREDWIELKNRSERALELLSSGDLKGEQSLSWWKSPLLAALDKLIQCYDDPESPSNMDWMARIYKYRSQNYAGLITVSGWVNIFFPYLGDTAHSPKNECINLDLIYITKPDDSFLSGRNFGNDPDDYPTGISIVDFILDVMGIKEYKMKMYGGPCCISEQLEEAEFPCPPGTLHAHFGWLIKRAADGIRQG